MHCASIFLVSFRKSVLWMMHFANVISEKLVVLIGSRCEFLEWCKYTRALFVSSGKVLRLDDFPVLVDAFDFGDF